jgi:hypothetical protein
MVRGPSVVSTFKAAEPPTGTENVRPCSKENGIGSARSVSSERGVCGRAAGTQASKKSSVIGSTAADTERKCGLMTLSRVASLEALAHYRPFEAMTLGRIGSLLSWRHSLQVPRGAN